MTASLRDPILLPVADPSQIGEARRVGVRLATLLGFDEPRRNDLAIVLTEAATNVLRHGGGGELILRSLDRDGAAGVEVLAVDRGPGIPNVSLALRDGYSTGGTAGTGLGSIRRLAAEFDLFTTPRSGPAAATTATAAGLASSKPGGGTVLMARLWDVAAPPPPPGGVEFGVVCLPKPGEDACGDAWGLHADAGRRTLVVADGLGHGLHAAEASRQAVRLFHEHAAGPAGRRGPAALLEAMHPGLRGTRGAAVAVVDLPPASATPSPATPAPSAGPSSSGSPAPLRFAGVGNIAGVLVDAGAAAARSALSHNGTLGVEARRFQEFAYPADPGGLLVLHSDGLASHWRLADYLGLHARHPSVVAGVLYRDHRRVRDDVTVLVVRLGPSSSSSAAAAAAAGTGEAASGGGRGGGAAGGDR